MSMNATVEVMGINEIIAAAECGLNITKTVVVSPDIASAILGRMNTSNRNMARSTVAAYAADMKAGDWVQNQQNKWCAFYCDGALADGQHRLAAIAESGISLVMNFEFGLSRDNSKAIDSHRARTVADQIKIGGGVEWIDRRMIEVVGVLFDMAPGAARRKTASETEMVCAMFKSELIWVHGAMAAKAAAITQAPVRAAIAIASRYEDQSKLERFIEILYSGISSDPLESAAIRLRDYLMMNRAARTGKHNRGAVMRATMRAIKLFKKKECKFIRSPDDMDYEYSIGEI